MSIIQLILLFVFSAVAITIASFLIFTIYHQIQISTFGWFREHMARSVFWTFIFFLFIPTAIPLVFVPFYFSNLSGIALPTNGLSAIITPVVIGSGWMGWHISYQMRRRRLREIGAWGWPESRHD